MISRFIHEYRRLIRSTFLLALFALGAVHNAHSTQRSPLKPANLRCEYRVDTIGMDQAQPRLSWIVKSGERQRGKRQTAYRIEVASSLEKRKRDQADVWDSGRRESDESAQITYAGSPLQCDRIFLESQGVERAGNFFRLERSREMDNRLATGRVGCTVDFRS